MNRPILLLILLIAVSSDLFGVHNLGSRLSYQCLDNGNYRIRLTDYLECASNPMAPHIPIGGAVIPLSPKQIASISSNCIGGLASPQGSWVVESFTDISRLCPGLQSSCQVINSIFYVGVAEWTAYIDYQLVPNSCGEYTFSVSSCCRDGALTSLSNPSAYPLYNEIVIPLNATPCNNSSPQFLEHPRTIVCNTDTASINLSAFDPDGDSLHYQFYIPKQSPTQSVVYNTNYSMSEPLGQNWYVDLDGNTGELKISAIGGSFEIGLVGVEVLEFRNGLYLGSSKIEVPIFAQDQFCNTPNGPKASPIQLISGGIQTGNYSLEAYVGIPLQFEITYTGDSSQSLTLDSLFFDQLPGVSAISSGTNPLTLQITWTPDSSYLDQVFYAGPTIADQSCFAPNFTYQPIRFSVNGGISYDALIGHSSCSSPTGSIDLSLSGLGPYNFLWSTGDSIEDLTAMAPGQYSVEITHTNGFILLDTFSILAGALQSNLTSQKTACGQSNGSIGLNPAGGIPPYTFQWNTGAATPNISNLSPGGYSVLITDSSGCELRESIVMEEADSCGVFVNGRVYLDVNADCDFNASDEGIGGVLVHSSQGYGTFSDSLGYYSLRVKPGQFSLKAYVKGDSIGCITGGYSLNLVAGQDTNGLDFPWANPSFGIPMLSGGMGNVVPGDSVRVELIAKTLGNGSNGGYLEMLYDSTLTYSSSSPLASIHDPVNRSLRWDYSSLAKWENYPVQAFFNTNPNLPLGTMIKAEGRLSAGGSLLLEGKAAAANSLAKQAIPRGIGDLGLIKINEFGHLYQLQFQNTSGRAVRDLAVRDSIDPHLEPTSLLPISSTHEFQAKLLPGGILEFFFENINLSDSAGNPENSEIHITFFVLHQQGLPAGTQIRNKSEISLDFYPETASNVVLNTLYTQPELRIDPNPSGIYCKDETLTALLTSQGMPPYTYSWNTGDTEVVNALQSNTLLDGSGWYVVSLVDSFGFQSIDSIELDVKGKPSIELNWTVGSPAITFDAGDSSITSYLWIFSNGDSSTDIQPTVDVSGLSSLEVELIASNECGTDTAFATILVTKLEKVSHFGEVKIMPHPIEDLSILQFSNPNSIPTGLKILDTKGKIVRDYKALTTNSFAIQKADLPSGIYLYQLKSKGGKVRYGKLIIR